MFLRMCAHMYVSRRPCEADGVDGNEESQTGKRRRDGEIYGEEAQRVRCRRGWAAPRGLGGGLGLIPHAWLEEV